MGRFFNLDSPLMTFLSKMADLMILNLLTLICCIPIITAGDAMTALYYMTVKLSLIHISCCPAAYAKKPKPAMPADKFSEPDKHREYADRYRKV